MIKILLVSRDNTPFIDMIAAFQAHDLSIDTVSSGVEALTMVSDQSFHLLITDEILPDMTGKDLIEKTVMKNPLMNCVAVSTLSPDDFHETYEGMGVLMQFPPSPGTDDVLRLLDHLNKIYSLSKKH